MPNLNKKEVIESFIRVTFSAIPYAGQALTEVFFDYSGRIKQNRLNRFIELLSEYFLNNPNINIDNIKTEDFSDLFDSVLRRVVATKSEYKLRRFRDILINQIEEPLSEIDDYQLYLDLIVSLSENDIKVLYNHRFFDRQYEKMYQEQSVADPSEEFKRYRSAKYYGISEEDFMYSKQNLSAKALLIDRGVGAIGVKAFEVMNITEFGQRFIHFLMKQ